MRNGKRKGRVRSEPSVIVAFPPKNVAGLKRMFPGNTPVTYLYLGGDFFARRALRRELGDRFRELHLAELLDEVADHLRVEHVHWIDALNRKYGRNLEWWFGAVSSRNIYSSNLFQYTCYLEILERLWNIDTLRPHLIVVESMALAKTIETWGLKKGIQVSIIGRKTAITLCLHNLIKQLYRFFKYCLVLVLHFLGSHLSWKIHNKPLSNAQPLALVDTYILDSSFQQNGTFKNVYFPYLHEFLTENSWQVLIHPVCYTSPWNLLKLYTLMRQSNASFIIPGDFLSISDYLAILLCPLKALRKKITAPLFRGFDLSHILAEEQKTQSLISVAEAILIYRLFLKLGKSGLQPEIIIVWYENQVIDKALIAGARQAFPEAKIIGAQSFVHSPNMLNLFPTQSESEAALVPHLLVETSPHQCHVAQSYTREIPCIPGAALRYAHVFQNHSGPPVSIGNTPTILIILPFQLAECIELLENIKDILGRIPKGVQFLVKGHPIYEPEELVRKFGRTNWPPQFSITQTPLEKAIETATLAISSNSSGIVEAAARGVPVISLGRETVLNQNVLANLKMNLITECFSSDELAMAINKYLNRTPEETEGYRKMGQAVRDLFFLPVNRHTMRPFLGEEERVDRIFRKEG